MARDPASAVSLVFSALRTFRRPWPLALAGLACTFLGLGLAQTSFVPAALLSLGAGVLLAGIAVSRRFQTMSWELEDRAESAGLLALSAFVALLAFLGVEKWDSGRIFLFALILVALTASFVVLLPRTGRRIVASILIVLHFAGIITAVTAVPPRNEPAPWLSMQIWTHFYRHYLTFAYLTNAYHFYSPDPGPPTLLWFHVEYADGTARWVKIPNRSESPVLLHHQRMLAAAESTNNPIYGLPLDPAQKADWEHKFKHPYELLPGIPHDTGDVVLRRRNVAVNLRFVDPNDNRPAPIRLVEDEPSGMLGQYSEPQEVARRLIASYARHIGRTSPHLKDPTVPVKAVRVYRVTHNLITPREYAEGRDPVQDQTTFVPFYMGKYDTDGRLLDPKDPFLFWHLPIVRLPQQYPDGDTHLFEHTWQPGPYKVVDFVEIHATQADKVLNPKDDD